LVLNDGESIKIISLSDTTLKFDLLYEGENEEIPADATALIVLKRIK
jgi:hypothetical protein